ncbi:MAG: putative DNA binding domain-containing protein [Bacteroidetes bacterium]|nr:putative DNA binding domain-containing protein [Bacteroidota bacterium]
MFNSPEELLRRIRLGENSSLELKAVVFRGEQIDGPSRDKLADELASMVNTNDCVVVLGVDDKTREIIGIPLGRMEVVERYIYEICNDRITPPVFFRSFRMELPDSTGTSKIVLKIEIPRSLFVHESPNGYFHRQGSSARKMSPEYLARMFQQRSQAQLFRFEEQPVPRSSINDLSKELWEKYTTRSNEPADIVLLKRSLLAKEESGALVASVAGILFCCEYPEHFLPSAFIEAVRYRGTRQDSNYQIDAQRIRGPLDRQIKESMAFLKRNQTVGAIKKPHRIEKPQFSERAIFEAVVNAVAHRDYSISGSKIRFFMFNDRLEIYSPGALPNTVTVDSMHLRQATRNELITSLLAETPVATAIGHVGRDFYMEKRGDGVPIIMNESERLSGKKPAYKLIDDSELLLTIYSAKTR